MTLETKAIIRKKKNPSKNEQILINKRLIKTTIKGVSIKRIIWKYFGADSSPFFLL